MIHFIVTRFALVHKASGFKITENWVEGRIKIFEKWCYDSVKSQTCKNFSWLILSTKQCMSENQIKKMKSFETKNIKNIFLDINEEITAYSSLTKVLTKDEIEKNNHKKIITTRLDGDDCISSNFVEKIQEINKNNVKDIDYVINFPLGYVYNTKSGNMITRQTTWPNMFTTLISNYKNNKFEVIQGCNHTKLKSRFKVIDYEKGIPMWLQTVNETNITTKHEGRSKTKKKMFLEDKNFEYMWNLIK